ncbi:hypothetical protein [Vibrio anguillarum]|uniref:3-demethylubiquinone-9 3-methyltransferase n=1 Tax=Vibrio anguillarum TaxID=55601 RepID=A0ABD4QQC3_VIBAN|nr:hypothetical protein [Vibrio anguillarum]ASG03523.1 hypothetical protein CEJ46_06580 [Vibrio anguillarum]MBT2917098.1 hypothetical protein [Vibrio anguillarum]
MDPVISQLKKDFYAQIRSLKDGPTSESQTTLALLTEEELQQLEQMWVELAVWKQSQNT